MSKFQRAILFYTIFIGYFVSIYYSFFNPGSPAELYIQNLGAIFELYYWAMAGFFTVMALGSLALKSDKGMRASLVKVYGDYLKGKESGLLYNIYLYGMFYTTIVFVGVAVGDLSLFLAMIFHTTMYNYFLGICKDIANEESKKGIR